MVTKFQAVMVQLNLTHLESDFFCISKSSFSKTPAPERTLSVTQTVPALLAVKFNLTKISLPAILELLLSSLIICS